MVPRALVRWITGGSPLGRHTVSGRGRRVGGDLPPATIIGLGVLGATDSAENTTLCDKALYDSRVPIRLNS